MAAGASPTFATRPRPACIKDNLHAFSNEMQNIDLSEHSCSDWKYVAEGGANLVVAYTGAEPRLVNTVLRVRKRALEAQRHEGRLVTEEDASVAFTDRIIVPLLGPGGTPTLTSLRATKDWLQDLANHIQASRPPARRAADAIDTDRTYVVLTDNLLREDVLGVEIKVREDGNEHVRAAPS